MPKSGPGAKSFEQVLVFILARQVEGGHAFTGAGSGKMLRVTYWITKKNQEEHFPTLTKIIESVKLIGS